MHIVFTRDQRLVRWSQGAHRSAGFGTRLFEWAIGRARERGCRMVQLTTDKSRPDAKRFYEALGFVASHEGMKLALDDGPLR